MKKLVFIILSLLISKAFSFTAKDIRFLTFENGLKMYLIEDTSSALVRMEIRVKAGYSSQDETNAGYFPLYARLKGAVIDSEGVSKMTICAPSDAEESLKNLSELLTPLTISEENLKKEISTERISTTTYANDVAGFINSAIEARVFPENPWRRESSTNPNIFTKNSISESRAILNSIAENFYTPNNTTLFISGNITATAAETFGNRYFSQFKNSVIEKQKSELEAKIRKEISLGNFQPNRKFVLVDKGFSEEMTQVVVQYTSLGQFECDMAATTVDEDFSEFKRTLTGEKKLGIRGAEYINAASNHKADSSRLVIQTLLEKTNAQPTEQIELFLSKMESSLSKIDESSMNYEIQRYTSEFVKKCDSSTDLMQILSDWATLRKDKAPEKTLFNRVEMLEKLDKKSISEKISAEKPFVFVLMNPKVYAKYEKRFGILNFEKITRGNGAWFNQKFYENLMASRNSEANEENTNALEKTELDTYESAKRFVERNLADFDSIKLSNGIPVTVKKTDTNTATLSITIKGGDLIFADNIPGLTAVLADALAVNIRNQLDIMHFQGYTKGIYGVTAKTTSTSSFINVTFASDEFKQTLNAVAGALIYGEISPAMGDGISYDERTQWRLKIGSSEFQMLSYAMRNLYNKQKIALLYDDTKDKPRELSYPEITNNYPMMLDSTRYSLILTGNFGLNSDFKNTLESSFGALGTNKVTAYKITEIAEPPFTKFEKRIQLRHLFLSDIGADKAGPMPAVLIPTTKFLDPVLYIMKSPKLTGRDCALFNALLLELAQRIEVKAKEIEPTTKVKVYEADKDLPFARMMVMNVEKTSVIDNIFKTEAEELKSDLTKLIEAENQLSKDAEGSEISETEVDTTLLSKIENRWIIENLSDSGTAQGTASLIQKSAELGSPSLYLERYSNIDNATAKDYLLVLAEYLSDLPQIRIYSADSKK